MLRIPLLLQSIYRKWKWMDMWLQNGTAIQFNCQIQSRLNVLVWSGIGGILDKIHSLTFFFSDSLYVTVRLPLIRMEKNKYPDSTGCSKVQENKSWAMSISLFIMTFNHPRNSVLVNLFKMYGQLRSWTDIGCWSPEMLNGLNCDMFNIKILQIWRPP